MFKIYLKIFKVLKHIFILQNIEKIVLTKMFSIIILEYNKLYVFVIFTRA